MILGRLAGLARESRSWDAFGDPSAIPPPGVGDLDLSTAYGVANEGQAMRVSAVYACTSLITETISTLPIHAFTTDRSGQPRPVEGPVPILDDPHPEMDAVDWRARIILSYLLRGNGYAYITAMVNGWPTEALPLHPFDCVPTRSRPTGDIEYRIRGMGTELAWPRGPIFHLRGMTYPGGIAGISPLGEVMHQATALALAAENFGTRFFTDGAHPSGALKIKDDISEDARGRAKARRIIGNFTATHRNRRLPALLTNGAEWEQLTINPDEAQFLETRRFQVNDIARIYRVPPHMIGDVERSTSWGTGIEQQGLGYVTYTLRDKIVRLERALSAMLPAGQYVRINVAGLLRADLQARYASYATGRQWGWLSVNDIRRLEEMDALQEGGDVYLQPINMQTAGTPAAPAPAAPREGDRPALPAPSPDGFAAPDQRTITRLRLEAISEELGYAPHRNGSHV